MFTRELSSISHRGKTDLLKYFSSQGLAWFGRSGMSRERTGLVRERGPHQPSCIKMTQETIRFMIMI